ncbi:MAG TPA: hypothetical protein PLL64_00840 [Rhodothermales bacterium]|mgnify:CR=1 FL=1|nr:hypothetical protein [Bacteroidota bacterium]HRK72791.1 hypothetical protein [Rhodothermales bacterium]HRR09575.1 hypothetical protein [Rhodothermales bacterium]
MKILQSIPLFAWLLLLLNIVVFASDQALDTVVLDVSLISGARFILDLGHLLLMVGVVVLYFEIIKATRTTTASVVDHGLSTIIFVVFLIEFITVSACGNATFLAIAVMSLVDVVAGFTVTISSAKRDLSLGTQP